ncbi:glycoside hydrolase [Corynascus novoguineensis]|uniref:Beta-xylanase n=1 Tax=Corynascus novoguineensis TaxID=1126955 RepID=A0AAN7CWU1_9PEZI|nr:glycoside hydrolase [Corynascus novoguineensis]
MARVSLALALIFNLVSGATAQNQTKGDGLHSLMVAAGKLYFGTAMETNNLDDAAYQVIASNKNEFGMITPENSQKWEVTEPTQGEFSFTQADQVAARAKANGQLLRCHTLTWHSQLPSFVSTGAWTPEMLTAVLTAHLTTVVQHYGGQCYAWDVVNEALNEDGSLRESVFLTTLGPDYIPLSFAVAARASDPGPGAGAANRPKLYYNDFNLETNPAKAEGAAAIVRLVRDSQIPDARVDGVGLQAHLTVSQTPSRADLAAILRGFAALDGGAGRVEVAYTELDIAIDRGTATAAAHNQTQDLEEQQAAEYAAVVGSCLDVDACVGVTVWQFTDKYSWVPATFPGKGEACLFTENFGKKKAYESVLTLLREAARSRMSLIGRRLRYLCHY